jgi:aspartate racemase
MLTSHSFATCNFIFVFSICSFPSTITTVSSILIFSLEMAATKVKTLGLLGGLIYQATAVYYDLINNHIRTALGKRHSAPLLLHSFDAEVMLSYAQSGDWPSFSSSFCSAAKNLENSGADAIVITAVLAHKVYADVAKSVSVPVLHIADIVAADIKAAGKSKAALLGAKDVMEADFMKGRLSEKHALQVLVPDQAGRNEVGRLIYEELAAGIVKPETKAFFKKTAEGLVRDGADCLILGSTDLGFVLQEGDVDVPMFTTAVSHAKGVAEWALKF